MARSKDRLGNKIRKGDYFVNSDNLSVIRDVTVYKFLSKGKHITKEMLDAQPNKPCIRALATYDYALNVAWLVPLIKLQNASFSFFTVNGELTVGSFSWTAFPFSYYEPQDIGICYNLQGAVKLPKRLCEPTVKVDEIKLYLALAGYKIVGE